MLHHFGRLPADRGPRQSWRECLTPKRVAERQQGEVHGGAADGGADQSEVLAMGGAELSGVLAHHLGALMGERLESRKENHLHVHPSALERAQSAAALLEFLPKRRHNPRMREIASLNWIYLNLVQCSLV